jgi:elongation factor P
MIAKEIKRGSIVKYNAAPCMIESITVQSPTARGASTYYKFRARNLITKQKVDITLRGGDGLEEADFQKRAVKYMYADPDHLYFLDQQNYETYALARQDVADEAQYVTDGLEDIYALIHEEQPVGLQLPAAVVLKVVETEPGIRGNSATGRTKPATLETGLIVQVPEYLEQGEQVKVDTRTGEFLSRA